MSWGWQGTRTDVPLSVPELAGVPLWCPLAGGGAAGWEKDMEGGVLGDVEDPAMTLAVSPQSFQGSHGRAYLFNSV